MKIKNSKIGVLLINLGTPDSPSVKDVRKYLREFLMDGRVIDVPWLQRFFLVNGIIAPFRAPSSAKIYKHLWTEKGSPLKIYGFQLRDLLQNALGDGYAIAFGMRYQSPSIRAALEELKGEALSELIVIPLYPQYASASTGSTIEKVLEDIKRWEVLPTIKCVGQFHDNPLFIKAFVELGREYMKKDNYDHSIFSYHGLPERQVLKASCQSHGSTCHARGSTALTILRSILSLSKDSPLNFGGEPSRASDERSEKRVEGLPMKFSCKLGDCCNAYHGKNQYCYRAQCFATTRALVKELGLKEGDYTTSFQSRLGKTPWIKPYTDEKIVELARQGKKRILAFSPSFVADCLETTIEIGVEYQKLFMDNGGQNWTLVESLNVRPAWVECLKIIVKEMEEKGKGYG